MGDTPFFTKERVERDWFVVDVDGAVLGRVATGIAKLLLGKTSAQFQRGQDCGGFVVAVNAAKLTVTGRKLDQKIYYRHSNYPGGLRQKVLRDRMVADSAEVLRDAVKGMLPKNRLGNRLITKFKVYSGPDHPHMAQQPELISLEQLEKL